MISTAAWRRDTAPRAATPVAGAATAADFAAAVRQGLGAHPKSLPAKFFYDQRGSELFEQICELPEYYPTRTEIALLERHAGEIAAAIGGQAALIEFGAGALRKVRPLLDTLPDLRAYLPIDISGDHLTDNARTLGAEHPGLAIRPVVADFTADFSLPELPPDARRVGFFPGSSIGNFTPAEARIFLQRAARLLSGGGLLIGDRLCSYCALVLGLTQFTLHFRSLGYDCISFALHDLQLTLEKPATVVVLALQLL